MNVRGLRAVCLVVLMSACAVACDDGGAASETSNPILESLPGSRWFLEFGTLGDEQLVPEQRYPITLEFAEDAAFGSDGCNSYGSTLEMDTATQTLEFIDMAQTARGCEPEPEVAEPYLSALVLVDAYRIDGRYLVLSGPGVELRFVPR